MKKPSRRHVVGGLVVTLLVGPLERVFGKRESSGDPALQFPDLPLGDPKAEALRAARFVNSAQTMWVHRVRNGFGTLGDLGSPEMLSAYANRFEPEALKRVQLLEPDIVPGFAATLEVRADKCAYTFVVVERAATNGVHFAYATDETGIIRMGSVPAEHISAPLRHFSGRPLQKPKVRQQRTTSVAQAVVGFFVPTVRASEARCGWFYCGTCFNGDAGQCGSSCANCCNLGYEDCRWCCMTWAGCGC